MTFQSASLTNMDQAANNPETPKNRKSKSASTTPTKSEGSVSSIFSKLTSSDKKKQKAEAKKLKKLLKSENKKRPSYLPDSSLQSPLMELKSSSVQLKSLRPKGSMANLRYQLPLKADPGISVPNTPVANGTELPSLRNGSAIDDSDATPPLPPRKCRASTRVHQDPTSVPPAPVKRTAHGLDNDRPAVPGRHAVKRTTRSSDSRPDVSRDRSSQRSSASEELDGIPPRPPKRRRLSGTGAPWTPSEPLGRLAKHTPVINHEGARERTEPLPAHPSEREGSTSVPSMYNSQLEAGRLFECLIHPVKPEKFFNELWERKPLLVKRHMPKYNEGWFTTEELDRITREHQLLFGMNIDVVTYTNGKRETHNPVGRVHAPIMWDYYQNGCSVRLLNPQTYCRNVWKLLASLQEYFGCCTGANVYLTPPGTQGFAPHYDDIEAFILQLEGKKHWKLYSPRTETENLARFSSANFTDEDIGEPILDVILEAGDLLYFPKGTIHQGCTLEDSHSLHITISCQQLNSWGDFMEKLVPQALQIAIDEDVEFRKSLPRDYLNHLGVAFSDSKSSERKEFLRKIEQLMRKLISYAPVDAAVDQMGKKFLHDSLPPVLTEVEKACSIYGNGERWNSMEGCVRGAVEIQLETKVKILRKGILRLVTDEDKVCVYHNLENTRLYHEVEPQYIEISAEMALAVEALLHAYPDYMKVDDLPVDSVEEKVELAATMYEKGMLVTKEPLQPTSDAESEEEEEEDTDTPI